MATSIHDVLSTAPADVDASPRPVPPSLAHVRSMLERFARYEIDGRPYVLTGGVGDQLLVFVPEGRKGLLTRHRTDAWSELPDVRWIRILIALGRFRRLDPPADTAAFPPACPLSGWASVPTRELAPV